MSGATRSTSPPSFPTVLSRESSDVAVAIDSIRQSLQKAAEDCRRLAALDDGSSPRWDFALECVSRALRALTGTGPLRSFSEFGGVLRQRREEAGLTQGEVAERAGLSEVLIRSIEVG